MIKLGDRIPHAKLTAATSDGSKELTTEELFDGKKVVLFAVPGAFTPTCSGNHLPPFIAKAEEIKAKGVDEILVTGVNDVFVMGAWAKQTGGEGKVTFLADGSADFAKAVGLTIDLSERGLGLRSQRWAMIVEDGVVRMLAVDDSPGQATKSSADAVLKAL
jgi:glutaredoxin/glutathione-dependent peroxiredoxin